MSDTEGAVVGSPLQEPRGNAFERIDDAEVEDHRRRRSHRRSVVPPKKKDENVLLIHVIKAN